MNDQIRYNGGGSLVFVPPEIGYPSSVTYDLLKPDETVVADDQSPTVDSVNTTLSSSVAAAATTISVASASGIEVGAWYILQDANDNRHHEVRVESISGTTITLSDELPEAFASGSSFFGRRITVAVTSGQADTLDENYSVRITYTVASVVRVAQVFFDIVRQPWPEVILTPGEFITIAGSQASARRTARRRKALQFEDEILEATKLVRLDILDRGHRPDLFRSFDAFKRVVAYRVIYEWAVNGDNIPNNLQELPETWLDTQWSRYQRHLTLALNNVTTFAPNDQEAAEQPEDSERRGRKRWRL